MNTRKYDCLYGIFPTCYPPRWSSVCPDDPVPQKTHIAVMFGGGSIYTPHPLHLPLSASMTNHASLAFIPPVSSIQELDSCKDSPRDWERARFEVWIESTLWASTCSSQEALEASFDSLIRVCYSWSFAPRRLEVPVSSHSFVVSAPGSLYYPLSLWEH